MNPEAPTHLPEIIDSQEAEPLLPREVELCELAGSLLSHGFESPAMNYHLKGVVLANELLWAHQSDSPADEPLHYAAEQLKCHHLSILKILTDDT